MYLNMLIPRKGFSPQNNSSSGFESLGQKFRIFDTVVIVAFILFPRLIKTIFAIYCYCNMILKKIYFGGLFVTTSF